jgi:hypothetical protein
LNLQDRHSKSDFGDEERDRLSNTVAGNFPAANGFAAAAPVYDADVSTPQ